MINHLSNVFILICIHRECTFNPPGWEGGWQSVQDNTPSPWDKRQRHFSEWTNTGLSLVQSNHVTWILDSDWSRLITWHVCWPLIGPQDVQSSCRTLLPKSTWIFILKILFWFSTCSQHLLYFSPFIDIWKGMTGNKMAHRWRYKNRIKDSFHFIESVEVMESLSLCVFVQCSQ